MYWDGVEPTLWELVRPIDVVTSDRDQGQLEAVPVCANHHLCRRFARRIRICRRKQARLAQVRGSHRHISINLIRRYMYEAVNTMFSRPLQQHMRAIHIRIRELVRVPKTEIDVRLRGEVENGIDLVFPENALHIRG